MVREDDHCPEILPTLFEDLEGGANHHVVLDDVFPQSVAGAGPVGLHHHIVSARDSDFFLTVTFLR